MSPSLDHLLPPPRHRRRVPIYFLLDVSDGGGERLHAGISRGLEEFQARLQHCASPTTPISLSVLTYATAARQLVPLTPIDDFRAPPFRFGGLPSLGLGLEELARAMRREVSWRPAGLPCSDEKPVAFLVIRRNPQGDWHEEASRFRIRDRADALALVSKDVPSPSAFKELTDHVATFEDLDRDGGEAVFRWLASVAAMSRLL